MTDKTYMDTMKQAVEAGIVKRDLGEAACYYAQRYKTICDVIAKKFPPEENLRPPPDYWVLIREARRDWLNANSKAAPDDLIQRLIELRESVGWKPIR